MKTIHINFISEQLVPNLIPTLSDSNCVGVIFVFGDSKLHKKGELLKRIYQQRGIDVIYQSQGKSSHDIIELKQQAAKLIEHLKENHIDKRWVLNATAGTKPMAFAMLMAFEKHNASLPADGDIALSIYTDSQNKTIPILNDNIKFNLPYRSTLNLEELLLANDFELENAIDKHSDFEIKQRSELTLYLAKEFSGQCLGMLGTLQYLATTASEEYSKTSFITEQTMKNIPHRAYAKVYQRLHDEKLIHWQAGSDKITFRSIEACRYLAGRWLEELVYLQARECGFEEVALNVEGHWGNAIQSVEGKNNEFDLLIRHNNQLLTIECKARNWDGAMGESTKQDTLHKLDNLGKKLGGLYGQNLLVSAYKLTDAMRERAIINRITICDNITINSLRKQLVTIKENME